MTHQSCVVSLSLTPRFEILLWDYQVCFMETVRSLKVAEASNAENLPRGKT